MQFNTFCDWKLLILLNKHNNEMKISRTRKNQISKENNELSNILLYQNTRTSQIQNLVQSKLIVLENSNKDSQYISIFNLKNKAEVLKNYNKFLLNFLITYKHYSGFLVNSFSNVNSLYNVDKNFRNIEFKNKVSQSILNIPGVFNNLNMSFILTSRAFYDIQNFFFFYKTRIFKFLGLKDSNTLFTNNFYLKNFLNILIFIFFVGFLCDDVLFQKSRKNVNSKNRILFKNRWKYSLRAPRLLLSLKNKNS